VREAVAAADIVVLAVPYGAVAEIAAEIAPVAAGKIIVDPTNPLKPD
jgi:predicted dinucleotide-binding enzyme